MSTAQKLPERVNGIITFMFTSSHYMVIWSKIYVIIRIPNLLQYVFIFNSFNLIFYLLNIHDDVWTEDDRYAQDLDILSKTGLLLH